MLLLNLTFTLSICHNVGMKPLTAKQEKFCQNLLSGMNQTEAYKNAYDCDNMQIETITNNAYMLSKKSDITARMLELYNMAAKPVIMSVMKRKKRLSDIAEEDIVSKGVPVRTWNLQAIDLLNKMDDVYKTDTRESQTIINIIVKDNETKDLLNRVEDNTHVIETGYKLLPNAPESTQDTVSE